MKVRDAGHVYDLGVLGIEGESMAQASPFELVFLKRNGGPVQRDEQWDGTISQEVIRALIDRTKYLDALLPCRENVMALAGLRQALYWYEVRAYRRHLQHLNRVNALDDETVELPVPFEMFAIEELPTCAHCGHILTISHEEHS